MSNCGAAQAATGFHPTKVPPGSHFFRRCSSRTALADPGREIAPIAGLDLNFYGAIAHVTLLVLALILPHRELTVKVSAATTKISRAPVD